MKSLNALNKVAPNSPLNIKLREVYAIKQSINNSHMPDHVKTGMMKECDRQINQMWRWHHEGKGGYENTKQDPRTSIKRVMKNVYNLKVDSTSESHLYGTNEFINMMLVTPHEGTNGRWMLRVGPMATFDRWANSTALEVFFDHPQNVVDYLNRHTDYVYQRLFERLSRETIEEREFAEMEEAEG